MKIFAFAASCAAKDSHTVKMADTIAAAIRKRAEKMGESVEYEMLSGKDVRIDYCRSCNNCFFHGSCPLDGKDDMAMLKRKLLECDLILFGTPVYLWQMSGLAKSFLDRISYWSHRYELLGKPCVVFSTTSSSHGAEVTSELEKLMSFTGAVAINGGYATFEGIQSDVEDIAGKVIDAYNDPIPFISPASQFTFLSMVISVRRYFKNLPKDREASDDKRVFRDRGLIRYVLLSEAIEELLGKEGGFYYRKRKRLS